MELSKNNSLFRLLKVVVEEKIMEEDKKMLPFTRVSQLVIPDER